MTALQVLLALLHLHSGVATTFSAIGDAGNPDPHAACLHRDLDDARDVVVASRTLTCGATVLICLPRTRRCVRATVGDRGPYGRNARGYRAELDLAPATRRALHHNGYETVLWAEVPR